MTFSMAVERRRSSKQSAQSPPRCATMQARLAAALPIDTRGLVRNAEGEGKWGWIEKPLQENQRLTPKNR